MSKCAKCGNSIIFNHVLIDDRIPEMSNRDKIIAPRCKKCLERLDVDSKWHSTDKEQKVILITGVCGSGKSSLGRALEEKTGFIHIDGDAVSKRVNWDIRKGYLEKRSGYLVFDELLNTIQVVLQLGYSVVATYVFSEEMIDRYEAKFNELRIKSDVLILKTKKDVCIERDKHRECWTAGEEFIEKWYDEQEELAKSDRWIVIDNSFESLNETVQKVLERLDYIKLI